MNTIFVKDAHKAACNALLEEHANNAKMENLGKLMLIQLMMAKMDLELAHALLAMEVMDA